MKSLTRLMFFCTILLGCATAHAQAFPDILDIQSMYIPQVPMEPAPLETQITTYEGTLNIPIVLNERTFLIPGGTFHAQTVSFSHKPAAFQAPRVLYDTEGALLFVRLLPHDWALALRGAVGVAGDYLKLDSDMLRGSGVISATRPFGDRLILGGGAMASWSFGELLFLPSVYIDWEPTDLFRIEAYIPAFARFLLRPHNRVELGLRAAVAGNSYAIRDATTQNSIPCADEATPEMREQCVDHVAYSIISGGLEANIRLLGTLWFTTWAGQTLYRRFEQRNTASEVVEGGLQSLPNEYFVRAGITWRIPME